MSSLDPYATEVGLDVLRRGGNAVDAAVATAAALGVTEPYTAGIGGGGFVVYYDADSGEVQTIDGRETAPLAMPNDAFINPDTGWPYPFTPDLVTSGVSVGVPGTPATWERALEEWGTISFRDALRPAVKLAQRGFVVDETFRMQTLANAERFAAIEPTADLYLPGGDAPKVGSVFRNRDLARTYRLLQRRGADAFYEGRLADQIVDVVKSPPKAPGTELPVPPGYMEVGDLAAYDVRTPSPVRMTYRGLDVYGMAPPSSGGSTVGEALNVLERFDLSSMPTEDVLHHLVEAGSLAFADREAYLGDSEFVDVPLDELLSDGFAAERACEIDPELAATKPVAAGDPDGDYSPGCGDSSGAPIQRDHEGLSTTHLTVADKWGNVVAYTLTLEQLGGSGITVPGRGFLLNNELTDFSLVYNPDDPNRIQPGKRPRSSMAPTIVLRDGQPWLTLGTPGGPTIITTVVQMLVNRIDLEMSLPEAVAEPRVSPFNIDPVLAEREFIDAYGAQLEEYGHRFAAPGDPGTFLPEWFPIGVVTAVEFLPDGRMLAAADPQRGGGGDAGVVTPDGSRR